ncbi:MAG: hypothetical protein WC269_03860 [Candidatus Gracilibacteria bacterium]|jgi:hypothetical protein
MNTRKKAWAVTGLFIVLIAAVGGFVFFKAENNVPEKVSVPEITKFVTDKTGESVQQATDDTRKRFDSKYGYTMFYPQAWVVDDSQKEFPVEFINEPSGKASVAVQTFEDSRLTTADGRKQALQDAEDAFGQDKSYTLKMFEWENQDKGSESNSYFAAGSFVKDEKSWRFMEIMTFSSDGTVFVLRANAIGTEASTYGPIAQEILLSFTPTKNLEKETSEK